MCFLRRYVLGLAIVRTGNAHAYFDVCRPICIISRQQGVTLEDSLSPLHLHHVIHNGLNR